jgi:8-oxo-dGTP diphosphatase
MKRILVVAAVIRREGRILIAERALHQHQGGLWEFPGGKVEHGEALEQALVRELQEELGITPTAFTPLMTTEHDYPDKSVCLSVWTVSAFDGEPHGREGQPLRWVNEDALAQFAFPAANQPIVTAARLPSRYLITPDDLSALARQEWLAVRLARGAQLVLFRAPSLSPEAYAAEAATVVAQCREAGARVMLHGHPAYLQQIPADGVHLPSRELRTLTTRPVPGNLWLAASVHDAEELALAERLGADFVTVSPVAATASHPGAPPLGWAAFAALTQAAKVPVYALGGQRDCDVDTSIRAGGQGIAGIRGLFAG